MRERERESSEAIVGWNHSSSIKGEFHNYPMHGMGYSFPFLLLELHGKFRQPCNSLYIHRWPWKSPSPSLNNKYCPLCKLITNIANDLTTVKRYFYACKKFMRICQNGSLIFMRFMRSSTLCIVMYGTIKIMRYKFMRPAPDSHNSHI